ncbi:unnamed protein product [Angiostrongylus costaricensis]|uniref:BZIP domain-containing protein n=1 Tax=Angiostrongylus costaricensis TaxID=334426 RepID=A0A0R3PA22_ANGCS|nr:unnamed protein product [Angiostrongylus costaricensis]
MTGRKRANVRSAAMEQDEQYIEKRRRNNEAVNSFRTREKKRLEESETARRVEELRKENERLERQVESLQKELSFLKEMFVAYTKGNRTYSDEPCTSQPEEYASGSGEMVDEETSLKFAQVVRECAETSTEAVETAEKLASYLRSADNEREGISLLDVKNREMLAYMTELSLLMGHMSCGKSIKENPSVFRAAKHRTILENIRPIEQKMRSQIERLIQGVHTGEVKAPLRARPEQMEFDDDSESNGEQSDNNEDEKKPKKYVPPKMMAKLYLFVSFISVWISFVGFVDEHDHQQTKAMEKAKRRALQSSLIQELKQQYSDAPEEFREKNIRKYKDDKEREAYEEDNFVRLRMTKAQKKREQRLNRDNALDDLFNFGNYMMRNESGEALSTNKKRFSTFFFELSFYRFIHF